MKLEAFAQGQARRLAGSPRVGYGAAEAARPSPAYFLDLLFSIFIGCCHWQLAANCERLTTDG
jgi:hypothetical protein